MGLYGTGDYGHGDYGIGNADLPNSTFGLSVYGLGVYGIGGVAPPEPPPPEPEPEPEAPPEPPFAPEYQPGYWVGAIRYGELVRPFGVVDEDGTAWTWLGIDGWDGPPVSGSVQQRAGDHGGWAGPQYYGPRPLTLRVAVDAPSQYLRDLAREQIQRIVPVSDLATLELWEPTGWKQVYVRRSGSLTEKCPNLVSCDFTIGLVAPDPRKFSSELHSVRVAAAVRHLVGLKPPLTPPLGLEAKASASVVSVVNRGNFESRPTIRITGAITAPEIRNVRTGRKITYHRLVINQADELVIDMDLRQARLNGSFRPADPTSSWWALEPGENTIELTGISDGSARMTVEWRDAWI